jgi:hypothetical protein
VSAEYFDVEDKWIITECIIIIITHSVADIVSCSISWMTNFFHARGKTGFIFKAFSSTKSLGIETSLLAFVYLI